jgi:hypothetical protein
MLCVGTDFALGGFDLIADPQRRDAVRARLRESGREVIELDAHQIGEFAGNALELTGHGGRGCWRCPSGPPPASRPRRRP